MGSRRLGLGPLPPTEPCLRPRPRRRARLRPRLLRILIRIPLPPALTHPPQRREQVGHEPRPGRGLEEALLGLEGGVVVAAVLPAAGPGPVPDRNPHQPPPPPVRGHVRVEVGRPASSSSPAPAERHELPQDPRPASRGGRVAPQGHPHAGEEGERLWSRPRRYLFRCRCCCRFRRGRRGRRLRGRRREREAIPRRLPAGLDPPLRARRGDRGEGRAGEARTSSVDVAIAIAIGGRERGRRSHGPPVPPTLL